MKFGDVVTAVASLGVVALLIAAVVTAVLVPMNPVLAFGVTGIPSYLVASLIVGYLFALKIQEESRMGAIGSMVVLFTVVATVVELAFMANPLASPAIKEVLESMYNTSAWTNYNWFVMLWEVVALKIVFALVLSFIGLYAGSMLRKPKKT